MSAKRSGESITILSIKGKDNIFTVAFEDGEKIEVSMDTFTDFHLYVGKRMPLDEFDRLMALVRQEEAYRLALKRLGHDIYSKYEMRAYLLGKGQDPRVIDEVINRLIDADLINDDRYATTFAEDVADLRLLGKNQVLFALHSKGIPSSILDKLSFPREKELEKAIRYAPLAEKRFRRTPKRRRMMKVIQALMRRGYDESVAVEAAESCAMPDDPAMMQSQLEKTLSLAITKYSRKYQGFELRQHVFAYLARRGYDYDDIKQACEEAGL